MLILAEAAHKAGRNATASTLDISRVAHVSQHRRCKRHVQRHCACLGLCVRKFNSAQSRSYRVFIKTATILCPLCLVSWIPLPESGNILHKRRTERFPLHTVRACQRFSRAGVRAYRKTIRGAT